MAKPYAPPPLRTLLWCAALLAPVPASIGWLCLAVPVKALAVVALLATTLAWKDARQSDD